MQFFQYAQVTVYARIRIFLYTTKDMQFLNEKLKCMISILFTNI